MEYLILISLVEIIVNNSPQQSKSDNNDVVYSNI